MGRQFHLFHGNETEGWSTKFSQTSSKSRGINQRFSPLISAFTPVHVLPCETETVLIKFQLRFENPGVLDKHKILHAPSKVKFKRLRGFV